MNRNTITRYERGLLPRIPKVVALAMVGLDCLASGHRSRRG